MNKVQNIPPNMAKSTDFAEAENTSIDVNLAKIENECIYEKKVI